eukprot:Hpha_TRINITY_DN16160_c1_g5::TRINITY_DN16160_c1_g5_i1::g.3225::m.3225
MEEEGRRRRRGSTDGEGRRRRSTKASTRRSTKTSSRPSTRSRSRSGSPSKPHRNRTRSRSNKSGQSNKSGRSRSRRSSTGGSDEAPSYVGMGMGTAPPIQQPAPDPATQRQREMKEILDHFKDVKRQRESMKTEAGEFLKSLAEVRRRVGDESREVTLAEERLRVTSEETTRFLNGEISTRAEADTQAELRRMQHTIFYTTKTEELQQKLSEALLVPFEELRQQANAVSEKERQEALAAAKETEREVRARKKKNQEERMQLAESRWNSWLDPCKTFKEPENQWMNALCIDTRAHSALVPGGLHTIVDPQAFQDLLDMGFVMVRRISSREISLPLHELTSAWRALSMLMRQTAFKMHLSNFEKVAEALSHTAVAVSLASDGVGMGDRSPASCRAYCNMIMSALGRTLSKWEPYPFQEDDNKMSQLALAPWGLGPVVPRWLMQKVAEAFDGKWDSRHHGPAPWRRWGVRNKQDRQEGKMKAVRKRERLLGLKSRTRPKGSVADTRSRGGKRQRVQLGLGGSQARSGGAQSVGLGAAPSGTVQAQQVKRVSRGPEGRLALVQHAATGSSAAQVFADQYPGHSRRRQTASSWIDI